MEKPREKAKPGKRAAKPKTVKLQLKRKVKSGMTQYFVILSIENQKALEYM